MRFIAAAVLLLVSLTAGAATLDYTIAPTTKAEDGTDLPATGPGALVSHRVEYGSCVGGSFGVARGEQIVNLPAVKGSFLNVAAGIYCLRAFPRSSFGEGKPYPVVAIGPLPSDGGSIVVVRVAP